MTDPKLKSLRARFTICITSLARVLTRHAAPAAAALDEA